MVEIFTGIYFREISEIRENLRKYTRKKKVPLRYIIYYERHT